jgi:hypothetical protein
MGADPIARGDGDYRDYLGSRLQHAVAATELRSEYHAAIGCGFVEKSADTAQIAAHAKLI